MYIPPLALELVVKNGTNNNNYYYYYLLLLIDALIIAHAPYWNHAHLVERAHSRRPAARANIFFGRGFDLENFLSSEIHL